MDEWSVQMRDFIIATESLDEPETIPVESEPIMESVSSNAMILQELADVVFKLRAFMENDSGDYALGVETGMQRAADMIENVILRHTRNDDE